MKESCSAKDRKKGSQLQFSCSQCPFSSANKPGLYFHVKKVHEAKIYKCSECHKSIKGAFCLKRHKMRIHRKVEIYYCNDCSYSTSRKDTLEVHIFSHHALQAPFGCPYCTRSYVRKSDVGIHIRRAHDEYLTDNPLESGSTRFSCIFRCDQCDFSSTVRAELIHHKKRIHNPKYKRREGKSNAPYKCPKCESSFKMLVHMKDHLKSVHQIDRPFACSMCTYEAKTVQHLKRHEYCKHGLGENDYRYGDNVKTSVCQKKTSSPDAARMFRRSKTQSADVLRRSARTRKNVGATPRPMKLKLKDCSVVLHRVDENKDGGFPDVQVIKLHSENELEHCETEKTDEVEIKEENGLENEEDIQLESIIVKEEEQIS